MNQLLAYARQFNSEVLFLTKAYVSKKESDPRATPDDVQRAYRAQKRIAIVCKEDILYMIKGMGPYLIKYRNLIKEEKWEEFTKMTYDEDIKSTRDESKQKAAAEYIVFFKDIYADCTPGEKKLLEGKITNMLSIYCQFVLQERDMNGR